MTRAALVSLLVLAGCFSKPSFSGGDAGSDGGPGDDAIDSGIDGPPPTQLAFVKLSAGGRHVCGIDTVGKLWCWGDNDHAQLGDTGMTRTGDPVLVSSNAAMQGGWSDVAAGTYHTCGIRAGTVYCWGRNQARESKPSSSGGTDVPMSAVAITGTPQKVFAGNSISCAIVQSGNAYCWGAIDLGAAATTAGITELTAGGLMAWTDIGLGDDHACAVGAGPNAGRLFCWGNDSHNGLGSSAGINNHRTFATAVETQQSMMGTRYLAVDATTYVTCAITMAHTLFCWGGSGQGHLLGSPDYSLNVSVSAATDWASVAIDETFACARSMSGTVQCWGEDHDGALGTGDFEPRASSMETVTVNDGTMNTSSLTVGQSFACALDMDKHAWCWGANRSGELGNGEIATKDLPSRVRLPALGPTDVIRKVVAGYDFTCALVGPPASGATAYCWGRNDNKQVDSQVMTLAEELPKASLPAGTPFTDIAAGELHVCGLSQNGLTLTCWGANGTSQLGRPGGIPGTNTLGTPGLMPWSAVAAGSRASCGISDGQLYCWGDVPGDSVQSMRKTYGRTPNGGAWQSLEIGSGFALGIAIDFGETYPTLMSFGSKCEGGTGTTGFQSASNPLFIKKGMFNSGTDEYALLVIAASQHAGHHTCLHYTTQENSTPRVTCFGFNESKQVNETEATCNGSSGEQTTPTWRMPVVGTQSIATANAHSCALGASNALYCWGGNSAHELSNRTVSNPGTPAEVPPGELGPWSGVTTGNTHTCVVNDAHKAVYCWGENRYGQLGDGTRFRPSPVASGLVPP